MDRFKMNIMIHMDSKMDPRVLPPAFSDGEKVPTRELPL